MKFKTITKFVKFELHRYGLHQARLVFTDLITMSVYLLLLLLLQMHRWLRSVATILWSSSSHLASLCSVWSTPTRPSTARPSAGFAPASSRVRITHALLLRNSLRHTFVNWLSLCGCHREAPIRTTSATFWGRHYDTIRMRNKPGCVYGPRWISQKML